MLDTRKNPIRPIVGVGAVVFKDREVLLIQRGKPPLIGSWSIPGGAQELGETLEEAVIREIFEETGITAKVDSFLDVVDLIHHAKDGTVDYHYSLIDYSASYISGKVTAGDDAAEARFFPLEEALDLPLWGETKRIIQKAATLRGLYKE
ncbi:NUDIX hydrolase [Kordiimonas pumila]|uniref:NUDIX hydrolase n=1 Tax=Kordiimonas pumila TaxID=2161677 RepID=A0ABV7D7K4_9PROT|nr:NUDIX hydrolase [Kordiimonas pumila]